MAQERPGRVPVRPGRAKAADPTSQPRVRCQGQETLPGAARRGKVFRQQAHADQAAAELKAKLIRRPEFKCKPFWVYPLDKLAGRFARREELDEADLMTDGDVMNKLGVTHKTVYNLVDRGELPKPRKIGPLAP